MRNWVKVALSDVAEVFNGKTPSKTEQRGEGHPVLKIRDVSEFGKFRGKHESFVDPSLAKKYSTKQVQEGDTLILNAAHNADYVGSKTYRAEPTVFGTLATGEWLIIRPTTGKLDAGFVHHWVTSKSVRAAIRNVVNGIHLYPKDVARLDIFLPPLPEQCRIAAILDQADALRVQRREALAQLDSLVQSIFIEMFGDPVSNPKKWKQIPFGDVLSNIDSGWSPTCLDRSVMNEEWGVLKLGAMTRCEYNDAENKALQPNTKPRPELEVQAGDLLFTRKNTYDLVAACVLVQSTRPRLLMPDLIFRFRLHPDSGIDACYLHQLLINPAKRREIQKLASGSSGSMPNISKAKLQTAKIEIPPLAMQVEFSNRVAVIEELKAAHRVALAELDTLFASLQHRAFRGEL